MPFLLIAEDDAGSRSVAEFRPKESVTVGRTSAARCEFPGDTRMSGLHAEFVAAADGRFAVKDLHSTNGTYVNKARATPGEPIEFFLDDTVLCGQTQFSVRASSETAATQQIPVPSGIHGHDHDHDGDADFSAAPPPAPIPPDASRSIAGNTSKDLNDRRNEDVEVTTGWAAEAAAAVVKRFNLAEQLPVAPEDGETTATFLDRLAEDAESPAAVTFAAYALPKRLAVWWAIRCVRVTEGLADGREEVLEEAARWVETLNDADRREAFAASEEAGLEHPTSWPGLAAFWADGSLAAAEFPTVSADDDLCGKAAGTAVTLASVVDPPEKAPERRKSFVSIAHEVADADADWEAK